MESKSSHLTHDVYDRLPPSHKVIISLGSARGLRVSWPAVSRPLLFSPRAKTLNKMRFHKLWLQLWNGEQAEMCLLEKQLLANNWCFPLNPHKEIVSRRSSFMKHSNAYKVSSWWSSPFEEKTTSKIMSSCLEFRACFLGHHLDIYLFANTYPSHSQPWIIPWEQSRSIGPWCCARHDWREEPSFQAQASRMLSTEHISYLGAGDRKIIMQVFHFGSLLQDSS